MRAKPNDCPDPADPADHLRQQKEQGGPEMTKLSPHALTLQEMAGVKLTDLQADTALTDMETRYHILNGLPRAAFAAHLRRLKWNATDCGMSLPAYLDQLRAVMVATGYLDPAYKDQIQ